MSHDPTGLLAATPAWRSEGICAQTSPEAFFPGKGGSTRQAKAVCASCPVRADCLEFALDHNERDGIWGGYSERERRRIGKDDAERASIVAGLRAEAAA